MDTIVYKNGPKAYVNVTNKCMNDCTFCVRSRGDGVMGYNLRLSREPSAFEIIDALGDLSGTGEVVFCGFGEPLIKVCEVVIAAKYAKFKGVKTRVNTNGLASKYHERDIVALLSGLIDVVSISLNAADAKSYDKMCHSVYGLEAFGEMLSFARRCVKAGIATKLTVVDVIGPEEIERARMIASDIGAQFRVRTFIG